MAYEPVGMASPPASPSPSRPLSQHHARTSIQSLVNHRAKHSISRMTDGVASRSSDDDLPRTAVKVAVRVRPALNPSDPGFELIPQRFRESTCQAPTPTSLSIQSPQGKKLFVFDRVFGQDTSQDGMWDYLSDSVSSFIKGYNVSILAYGQSGSGKSYTMGTSGPNEQNDPKDMGIVPRAARTLFEKLNVAPQPKSGIQLPKRYSTNALGSLSNLPKAVGAQDKNWTLKATYVEIYQEQLRDLLIPESVPAHERAQVAIREDTKGRILVTGLTQKTINSVEDLLSALSFGSSIRQTDATNINARSSRSHAVFSLNLIQKKNEATSTPKHEKRMSVPLDSVGENVITLDSKLHFVDLAGSERLKNTGATGDRAKEGISINAGLASLGKVISQLSSKHAHAHISYRDSRLTRMLQDSLGGNAITFMVACVTPAVFHLSETLNTVHYAQRARAIQSKPEIQQSREDGDKQAAIDRLRAEVSFLRDQIRHSEHSQNKTDGLRSFSGSGRGREAEMQQQIMDMQENYNALSQRHTKLISDLSKAKGGDERDLAVLDGAIGENATERIKRSSSFAEAVELMVIEYEKTIQTLESSLTTTRGTLANSESTLMEKETRIAYMETVQQQLQARIQKAQEREQGNESYLRDLEAWMEGSVSGEEKNAAVITELRKELTRVRENENNAEDYISTLEERLADAEQDAEIMQREIDRLEHVVERQRSIGRLDNLLGELDVIRAPHSSEATAPQQLAQAKSTTTITNGYRDSHDSFKDYSVTSASVYSNDESRDAEDNEDGHTPQAPEFPDHNHFDSAARIATQSDFMADKLENLTQELFDLRSEHETVMTDYDMLQQKYKTALETLAKVEYEKERPRTPDSSSFLADAGMRGEAETRGEQPSSSPSSSQEALSSLEHANSSLEALTKKVNLEDAARDGMDDSVANEAAQIALPSTDAEDDDGIEKLQRLNDQKEFELAQVTASYNHLLLQHESALEQVEDLKMEVQKAQSQMQPTSPFRPGSQAFSKSISLFRRKSEDLLGNMDARASRSLAALKTMAHDNLENDPDIKQAFDINLNSVMSELQTRSERIFALEAEMGTIKKELDAKQTIISGLTRERSSLKASSTVDFSIVGQMQEQLQESEKQIHSLREQLDNREQELQKYIGKIQAGLATASASLPTPVEDIDTNVPGEFPATPNNEADRQISAPEAVAQHDEQNDHIERLQSQLEEWETKHNEALASMNLTEAKLHETIAGLEVSLRAAEAERLATSSNHFPATESTEAAVALASIEEERNRHRETIDNLQNQVEDYRLASQHHQQKAEQLEFSYQAVVNKMEEDSKRNGFNVEELRAHQNLVSSLESQLQVHKSAIALHQDSLESLQASHSKEMDDLQASLAAAEAVHVEQYSELEKRHEEVSNNLQQRLTAAQNERSELLRNATSALGYEADAKTLHSQIKGLVEEGKELHSRHLKTTNELKAVQEELRTAISTNNDLEARVAELKAVTEETLKTLGTVTEREKKSSRLVEELEEQLNNNFDSHKAATNRISIVQDEAAQRRIELERELEEQKMRNSLLEQQIGLLQRQSVASNNSLSPDGNSTIGLGRTGSAAQQPRSSPTGMPMPPPSIPLPPLPSSPITANGPQFPTIDGFANGSTPQAVSSPQNSSPPGSRHVSKDGFSQSPNANSALQQQQHSEEQEARIRTIEKHLFAEKQLTATLEEALVDLETSANRTKIELDGWRKKASQLEDELTSLRRERSTNSRASLQAVEEERERRLHAERARQALEQRMLELNAGGKKKKSALNCF